jgi:hypothetical protein
MGRKAASGPLAPAGGSQEQGWQAMTSVQGRRVSVSIKLEGQIGSEGPSTAASGAQNLGWYEEANVGPHNAVHAA